MTDRGWRGRPLVDDAHAPELESRATIHELSDGLPRHEAEAQAYEGYLNGHMRRAAAHHLAGVRAAHAVGDMEAAAQHGFHYGLLGRALGFDPAAEPPEDVLALSRDPEQTKIHDFKHHGADAVIMRHLAKCGLFKSEADEAPLAGVSTGGMWDMSHLLPELRRAAGERLMIQGAPGAMTAHHLREEAGRRIPLASLAETDGDPEPMGTPAAGDVVRSAALAFRVRCAAEMAAVLDRARRVAIALAAARHLA